VEEVVVAVAVDGCGGGDGGADISIQLRLACGHTIALSS